MGYFIVQTVKTFNSSQEILDYVQSEDYDTLEKPGICYAIHHIQNGESNHEFKFMFNDQESEDEHNQPSQTKPSFDKFQSTINQDAYMKYAREGYNFAQNWMANELLRSLTRINNATIVSMTAPMRSEPIVFDRFDFVIQNLFPLCMVLMFILPILRLTSRIASEKHSGVSDFLRVMSLN